MPGYNSWYHEEIAPGIAFLFTKECVYVNIALIWINHLPCRYVKKESHRSLHNLSNRFLNVSVVIYIKG